MVFLEKCKRESTPINTTATQAGILPGDNYNGTLIPKPKKMKLPKFSGNIRNFARFIKDFGNIVHPWYPDPVHQAYILRGLLKGTG